MLLVIDRTGTVQGLYGEAIDLAALGVLSIRRASHVEPDEQGRWWADLRASGWTQTRAVRAALHGVGCGGAVAGASVAAAASGAGVMGCGPAKASHVVRMVLSPRRWPWVVAGA